MAIDRCQSIARSYLLYAGYYAWRAAPNESDLSPETRKTMFPYYSFFLADRLQALGYPISGADDELRIGHRRYNFGWFRVADAAELKQMCADDNGHEYEFGVPIHISSGVIYPKAVLCWDDEKFTLLPGTNSKRSR